MPKQAARVVLSAPSLRFLAIDPSMTRTGVALGSVEAFLSNDRIQARPDTRVITKATSFRPRSNGGFRDAMAEVAEWIPAGGPWVPVLERPPPARKGDKHTSIAAFMLWRQWISDVAHDRAEAAGDKYRAWEDALLDPMPGEWRAPLGLPTGAGLSKWIREPAKRAEYLKQKSLEYAAREALRFGPLIIAEGETLDHDAGEAVCLFTWAVRAVGSVGTWVRPGGKIRRLLALV